MCNSSMKGDITALIVRLIIGGVFIFAGWTKISGIAGTLEYFNSLGIPAFLTYIVSYGELIGGLLIVLGLWTCLASVFLSIVMIVAIWLARNNGMQAMMTPLVTLAGLVSLIGSCAGKYSLASFCKMGCCKGGTCNAEAPKVQ